MTLRDIDKSLALWNSHLATAAQNLMDLQSQPAYKRLTAPEKALQGKTAAQGALAVNTLRMLLQYYELLQSAVRRAEELRQDMPALFGVEQRIYEIRQVLEGQSIQLPPLQIPFGQRKLLGNIQDVSSIAPKALLNTMVKAFEEAKSIVMAIESAWESLGVSLDSADNRMAALHNKLIFLNGAERSRLHETESRFYQLRQAVVLDPLGAREQLVAEVFVCLDELEKAAAQARQLGEQVAAELESAEGLLTTIRDTHHDACRLYAEVAKKIAEVDRFSPKPDTVVEALESWLQRLEAKHDEAATEAMQVGLRNWTQAARETLDADRICLGQSKQLLETRSELRGRLDALKAKARAYSLAEEQNLLALGEQAHQLLYLGPTPLNQVARLVSEYETKLNSLTKKSVKN